MPTTKIGRRGQITIPKSIRQAMQVSEGDRVAFVRKDGDIVLQPIRTTLRDHRGTVPLPGGLEGEQDFEAVRGAVRQSVAGRNAQKDLHESAPARGVKSGPGEPRSADAG